MRPIGEDGIEWAEEREKPRQVHDVELAIAVHVEDRIGLGVQRLGESSAERPAIAKVRRIVNDGQPSAKAVLQRVEQHSCLIAAAIVNRNDDRSQPDGVEVPKDMLDRLPY